MVINYPCSCGEEDKGKHYLHVENSSPDMPPYVDGMNFRAYPDDCASIFLDKESLIKLRDQIDERIFNMAGINMASLNREQWEEMWKAVQKIQWAIDDNAIPSHCGHRKSVKIAVSKIKGMIQEVIGQME